MADVKYYEEKVEKAQAKVDKCKGTIARHQKQLEKKIAVIKKFGFDETNMKDYKYGESGGSQYYWEICDVEGKQSDIKGAERKLADAERVLQNWKDKLVVEQNKEAFLNNEAPQVIVEFLAQWKEKATDWHIVRHEQFQTFKKQLQQESEEAVIEFAQANPEDFKRYLDEDGKVDEYWERDIINIRGKGLEKHLKELNLDWQSIRSREQYFAGMTVLEMDRIRNVEDRLAYLEKVLEAERKAKLLDLVVRIKNVVGKITDASNLKISQVGNLNGVIQGEDGKAKVETIGAGGYNIQVFHYRTIINKINNPA